MSSSLTKWGRRGFLGLMTIGLLTPLAAYFGNRASQKVSALEIDPNRDEFEYRDGWIMRR